LALPLVRLVVVLVFFEAGLDFLILVFGFVAFLALVNVFALPFAAFLGVIFDREGAFVAPFDFGLDLVPALAFFLGLALVDEER
jgi:hypothetical protein